MVSRNTHFFPPHHFRIVLNQPSKWDPATAKCMVCARQEWQWHRMSVANATVPSLLFFSYHFLSGSGIRLVFNSGSATVDEIIKLSCFQSFLHNRFGKLTSLFTHCWSLNTNLLAAKTSHPPSSICLGDVWQDIPKGLSALNKIRLCKLRNDHSSLYKLKAPYIEFN